jgi:hypothetical protein
VGIVAKEDEDWIERSLFALGVVVFFFVVGGPSRDEMIWEDVRCVPGPGAYFVEGARDWPGRARVGRDIVSVIWALLIVCDRIAIVWSSNS